MSGGCVAVWMLGVEGHFALDKVTLEQRAPVTTVLWPFCVQMSTGVKDQLGIQVLHASGPDTVLCMVQWGLNDI